MSIQNKKFKLGTNGPMITMGLGCMGMSAFYGTIPDEKESIGVIHHALNQGVNFFDTADLYGWGHNEEILGKAIKSSTFKREDIIVATKFTFVKGPNGEFLICGKPDYVKKACDASLKRLGLDYIDLYYQHRVDPETPIEDTVKAMAELVKEGKVKYLGLSECSADTLRRAHAIHPITAVQSEYSFWCLDPEQNEVLKTCQELGITFVAYSPLGRGFLTGAIKSRDDLEQNDFRQLLPRFSPENFPKNLELVDKLNTFSSKRGYTASQLALGWLMHIDGVVPIPGTRKIKYLDENLGANKVTLSSEELKEIRDMLKDFEVKGDRYPTSFMSSLNK
eukprot:TRINITY_DN2020_c1_g1_i1.p1 TRINITY_DN2020_c1_g1~~TRINITY_DN2020_c1_g1_i1.p1  ORF type:complete len:335 (+),score=67.67 TRINITY_DN2020_c1_g1_i1:47-1051(+)